MNDPSAPKLSLAPILIGGLLLRGLVYLFLDPGNNDPHHLIIDYILQHGVPPRSDYSCLSFHPPLYYLMASVFARFAEELVSNPVIRGKIVQSFSLLLSIGNLFLIYLFVARTQLLTARGRVHALLLASVLPQFVIFGNFISNDSLSYLVGTICFVQAFRYIETPHRRNLVLLALALGAGLLTKGTFIAFVPVLVGVVAAGQMVQVRPAGARIAAVALFCSLLLVTGGYKFVENTIHMGRPIVHGLDMEPEWMHEQLGTYQGLGSILDVNVLKLVRDPFLDDQTRHSFPLLLYGTFWQPYILESNLVATREGFLTIFPRLIYVAGIPLTLLMLIGLGSRVARSLPLRDLLRAAGTGTTSRQQGTTTMLLLSFNLAIVVAAGVKYDVWSCFQGRLLFPSMIGLVLASGWGVETIARRAPRLIPVLDGGLAVVYALLAAYLAVEIGHAVAR